MSFAEYRASNFVISVSNVSGVVANKALGIIIDLSLERLSLLGFMSQNKCLGKIVAMFTDLFTMQKYWIYWKKVH